MQLESRLENACTLIEHFNNFQNDIELLDEYEIGSNVQTLKIIIIVLCKLQIKSFKLIEKKHQ